MTDDDPIPLKAGGEASPELVRALRALGEDSPDDAARLQRVAQKLGAALADAPQPGAASAYSKLLGVKTLITGIVIGLAALSWLGYQLVGRHEGPVKPQSPASVEVSRAAPVPEAAPEVIAPVATHDAEKLANVAHVADAAPEAPSSRGRARRAGRHSGSAAHAAAPRFDAPSSVGSISDSRPASADTAQTDAQEAQEAPQVAPKPKQVTKLAEQPERPAAPAPRTEVELLFEARKAARSQPSAALQLLDEHAARFPSGQLAPEREVLRIEALRRLGRTQEANERLQAFEARYPDSIHLRRLQRQSANTP